MKVLVLALAAVILVLAGKCITIRKSLAVERESIDAVWSQVDVALVHRADLIPSLADTVRAEAPDQAAAAGTAQDARSALDRGRGPRDKIRANARVDEALARLLLLAENYPKLQGSKKFGDLLEDLKAAEYQIAVARRKYNEAVEHYNARIALFPDNLVAFISGFPKIDVYFQTPVNSLAPVKDGC